MFHSTSDERRKHKRFFVKGSLRLKPAGGVFGKDLCEVINVSRGGILILSKSPPVAGIAVEIEFTVEGYHTEIHAKGRVVRDDANLAAIAFKDTPEGIDDMINWLEAGVIGSLL